VSRDSSGTVLTGADKDAAAPAAAAATTANKPKKRRTHCILLIRHGQYVTADTDQGRVLTPLGRQQASLTGQRLEALLASKKLPPVKVCATVCHCVPLCVTVCHCVSL
jgi:hypothetical protein